MGSLGFCQLVLLTLALNAAGNIAAPTTAPPASDAQLEAEHDMLGIRLIRHPACAADIHRICAEDKSITLNDKTPNIDVIGCLLDQQEEQEDAGVSKECHHVLWQLRHNLTRSTSLARAVDTACSKEQFKNCDRSDPQPGHYVSCVMEHLDDVEDDECAEFLENLSVMIFSDYRMIYKFAQDCGPDIDKHQCGRLEDDDENVHSQGKTIECVSSHMDELSDSCKLQVLRVAELQAEDYHMDRPLYFACRDDRERFCANIVSGNGKVYQCLLHHKMEQEMSKRCRQQLTRRQKMTAVDYKVDKRLRKACKPELAASGCHQAGGQPSDTAAAHSVKLSFVLLCLEDHQKSGHTVSGECLQQVTDHRRALMEDFSISPEVVMACAEDIPRLCEEETQNKNGKVIHCLMMHSNPAHFAEEQLVSAQCQRQVEDLLTVVEVADQWNVDPVLRQACSPVAREACADADPGEMLSCLAEAVGTEAMTPACEQVLLQIQFFMSRDFKLDPQLYKACHEDARTLCAAPEHWWQPETDRGGVDRDPNVLPCLYRNIYHADETQGKVSPGCRAAVRRVMKNRADQVDLHPRIQSVCMTDLAKLCSEHSQRGHEIRCLQDNYFTLSPQCHKVIKSVTEDEARYIELNPEVAKACKQIIKQNCMKHVEAGGDGVMECLIRHKSDRDVRQASKCWAAINHFQIISMEDYSFSFRFKQNCQEDVAIHCRNAEKKADVIHCLSGIMLNNTLADKPQQISEKCRRQVQLQLREREENEDLDPRLNAQCGADIHKYCKEESETKGSGKVLECLREHVNDLSAPCSKLLFRRQQQSLILPKADYFLFSACKGMILKYCASPDVNTGAEVLDCLKGPTQEASFDPTCGKVVSRRLAEQKRDYRLHPALRSACMADAERHCASELAKVRSGGLPAQGRVTACLADAFRLGQLTDRCGRQLDQVLREAARDVRQDPLLGRDCRNEITQLCADEPPETVGECLRLKLADGQPMSDACAQRVARIVEDVNVDVHTDPQLSAACALDLQKHCRDVPAGHGAQLTCLMELKEPTARCADMIALRMKMIKAAIKVRPAETVQDLYVTVRDSPSRDYFVILAFGILIVMFFGGLCCGRATKRAKYIQKMK
ncbi:Golgi apparatus protein 1-like [Amphibalanus amphitrite]|uniref:Golgi apparatus protein 1-like n=1 Tax=Amphibalanus amphitrite TaxID=1232801 RepID=UPI001C8FB2AC|nr:Golgi apparatus protein 1-like [Amphibalanus amphitrite]XP_043245384.1 Golgi apparatus protein 1-like [Amphibalanus amphitrite]XP_043245385.1 Golgi apparatus protein 1-like [Amphibalanus amphitrite]XP_043245386.1 Golgi apparatus protein 1-like [Amphibalanus amphitrite]XP_043245387.1 Golgi apparatus protein 1-like [Amphibalanus amphitrite]XP_043245388.1 Golgi apparatus protein 1-like [Amphibalanus amphitrite]XP_043245389.1 Golgi apparatus protein 1-like [Amphibalanus amphitrite]XP_04324539